MYKYIYIYIYIGVSPGGINISFVGASFLGGRSHVCSERASLSDHVGTGIPHFVSQNTLASPTVSLSELGMSQNSDPSRPLERGGLPFNLAKGTLNA